MLEAHGILAISTPVSSFMLMLMLYLRRQTAFGQKSNAYKQLVNVSAYAFFAALATSMVAPFVMIEAAAEAVSILLYQIGSSMAVASGWVAARHPKRHMLFFKAKRFLQARKSERECKTFLQLVERVRTQLPPDHETHDTLDRLEQRVPQWIEDRESLAEAIAMQRVDEAIDPEMPHPFDKAVQTDRMAKPDDADDSEQTECDTTGLISPSDTRNDMQAKYQNVDEKIRTAFHIVRHLPHKIRNRASRHQTGDNSDFNALHTLQQQALDAGEQKRLEHTNAREEAHACVDPSFDDVIKRQNDEGESEGSNRTVFSEPAMETDDTAGSYESFAETDDTDDNKRRAKVTLPENNPQTVNADE